MDEMNSVAGGVLESQRTILSEANAELERHSRQSRRHLQEYEQQTQHDVPEVHHEVRSQQVPRREEIEKVGHGLSQSQVEVSRHQTLYNKAGAGATEQVHRKSSSCDKCGIITSRRTVSCLDAQVAQILRLRGMLEVERAKYNTLQADVLRLKKIDRSLKFWIGQKKRLPSCELAAMILGNFLNSHRMRKVKGYLSQELEWMHMEENRLESATVGGGGHSLN